MLGAIVALTVTAIGRRQDLRSWRELSLPVASASALAVSFATVVVAGYAIELNATYFGAGDPAQSAA